MGSHNVDLGQLPESTVNLEIFAGILFSRIACKDIFAKLNIRD